MVKYVLIFGGKPRQAVGLRSLNRYSTGVAGNSGRTSNYCLFGDLRNPQTNPSKPKGKNTDPINCICIRGGG